MFHAIDANCDGTVNWWVPCCVGLHITGSDSKQNSVMYIIAVHEFVDATNNHCACVVKTHSNRPGQTGGNAAVAITPPVCQHSARQL